MSERAGLEHLPLEAQDRILALRAEVERLTRELDEARATKDLHKARQEQEIARAAYLRERVVTLEATLLQSREAESRRLLSQAHGLLDCRQMPKGCPTDDPCLECLVAADIEAHLGGEK